MKILSTTSSFGKLDNAAADFLRSTGHILERNPHGRTLTEDEVIEFLECHRPPGIIAGVEPLTGRVLHGAAAYLKVISRCGTGLDNVDLDAAKELGIVVMNTPEAPAEAVAELTIGLIFALLRNIVIHNQVVCGGSWAKKTGYLISETTVGLVGESGSGKTTIGRALLKLIPATAGEVIYEGRNITNLPAHEIVKLGLAHVPEGRMVFANLTVLENLQMGAYLRSDKPGIAADMDYVFNIFPRLKERAKQISGTLSGGEQQMLAIGRALMSKPKFLMLDEPSLGIAPLLVKTIFQKIVEINQQPVNEPGDVVARMKQAKDQGRKSALFLIANAAGESRFVALPVE